MTKEDIAEILCLVGNAILSKSKNKQDEVIEYNEEEPEESTEAESFDGDFDDTLEPLEQVSDSYQQTPQQIPQQLPIQPVGQTPQNINSIFTPATVPVEIQNMLQQKESQIANLQSQLSAVQTSNLGFTPIKL